MDIKPYFQTFNGSEKKSSRTQNDEELFFARE